MSNIRGLHDDKKEGGRGGGMPQGGPGNAPPGGPGGLGGMFGGLGSMFGMGGGAPGGSGGHGEGNIKVLNRDGQLKEELAKAGGKLVVVDFTASWCGPCKQIAPVYADLSNKYPHVVFLKIDVDQCPGTAKENSVRSMPTFQFFKNNSKIDEFSGASPDKLRSFVDKYQTAPSGFESGSGGYTLGSTPSAPSTNQSGPEGGANVPSGNSLTAEAREARLRRLEAMNKGGASSGTSVGSSESSGTSADAPIEYSSAASSEDINLVFLATLIEMGFPEGLSKRALKATNAKDIEQATEWCLAHAGDEDSSSSSSMDTSANSTGESNSTSTDGMDLDDTDSKKGPNFVHKDLTPEELEIEKAKLNERLIALREKRAAEEKQAEIEREKMRIKGGKDAQEAKKKWEQDQKAREAAIKKKQDEEDRIAKAKIKAKIAQDKAERIAAAAKNQSANSGGSSAAVVSAPAPVETPVKKEYSETNIQVRLPDGNTIKATFKPSDSVRSVHDHISMLTGSDRFNLQTTFPRKVYSTRDSSMNSSLAQEGMVPSGTFLVQNL